jgi:flagellar biosynthesis protein FlhF
MHLQTFSAPTMAEALRQVKTELGKDAVILHTRTYLRRQWMGLRRREVVEITAGTGFQVMPRPQARRSPTETPAPERPVRRSIPRGAMASPSPRSVLDTPAAGNAMIMGLSQEMSGLKSMVLELVHQTRAKQTPDVPEDLFDYYMQLVQNQVADELAADMLRKLQSETRAEHLRDPQFVKQKLAEQLEQMLPAAKPLVRTKTTGPHVVALIGPTGVGKTTTIAKLAANLKLRQNHRVGLITIDTYRIAAVDQLKKYADIIGSPLRVVSSPDDLQEAVESMADQEYVLIDTAGRSPTDTLRLNELRSFLTVAHPDEVYLVLSTTASQDCIESAIAHFSRVRVDKIIFTKLDEAVHVGVVFNVMRKINKSLAYITTGQDVPDDIEAGGGQRLARLILGGKP